MKELSFEEYGEIFCTIIPKASRVDKNNYLGRCIVCGDSQKVENRKRLYLMREDSRRPAIVYCHNCGLSMSANHFFCEYAKDEIDKRFRGWNEREIEEIKAVAEGRKSIQEQKLVREKPYCEKFTEELQRAKVSLEGFFDRYTNPITAIPEAQTYMINRMIPERFVTEMRVLGEEFYDHQKYRFAYFRDYVLIPFIDPTDNKAYYFHSRRFRNLQYKQMAKYLACPYRPDESDVDFFLNELRVDSTRPVVIAEGTLDSLNIPNSIAVNGIKKITPERIHYFEDKYGGVDKVIYALDNELIDRDARKMVKSLLKKEKRVFLWSLLAKDFPNTKNVKDFNGLCCLAKRDTFPAGVLEKYTTRSLGCLV